VGVSRAPVVSLAPGVHRLPTLGDYINSYAFVNDDGSVTLIDCGIKRAPAKIVAGLAAFGKHPGDVQQIILTHAHSDHAGGSADMVKRTGVAGVTVHVDEVPFVETGEAPPRDTSTRLGAMFAKVPFGGFARSDVVQQLHDGDLLPVGGGLRIMHTPGHSPGHISLKHESTGILITGDAIWNMRSKMTWPTKAGCTSFKQNVQTAQVLGEVEYAIAAFTHGPEIRDNAREAVRGFLRKAAAKGR